MGIAHLIGLSIVFQVVIGLAVIAGHNWPVFLRFNAGRGLATSLGVCFVIFPFGIVVFVAFAVFTLVIKTSALPSLFGMAAMPVSAAIMHKPIEVTLGLTVLLLIMILRRLTAPLAERSKNLPKGKLLLYRFLYDRDIRDGKAWTSFQANKARSENTGNKK